MNHARTWLQAGILAAALSLSAASYADNEVIIYTNADEEAQQAMRHALDQNGFAGKYLLQSFGTSELGGRLQAEGKNIEADIITLSSYYLDSLQAKDQMFVNLPFAHDTLAGDTVPFYAPLLGNTGAMFVNTEVLAEDGLPEPKSLKELAEPKYAGHISVPDITGSSTAWLMTQALIDAYGEDEGSTLAAAIEQNAGDHLEMSGSGPLKKIRAGEVAIGFGLRHQAVADKARGLPVDYVDPAEGNFTLTEALAVVDKGSNIKPDTMSVAECIVKKARPELLQYYPVALYPGEEVSPELKPAHPRVFKYKLTVELLQKHQQLVKAREQH